ncbi:MAG: serine hydroxymethyltransferase [Planctomycetes bacterium]|nr:serine hydroxymethyltransferase [Planctomycetota bacterium]
MPSSPEGWSSEQYHGGLSGVLAAADGEVYQLLTKEYDRQQNTLQLIAAENQCSRAVLAALGSVVQNKTTEGFAGARFHGGCAVVDCLETLAIGRAKEVFQARYANVQPHSGTGANQIVITALLEKGDRILSQAMDQGGHVSHGAPVSFAGKFFEIEPYCVRPDTFLLDYDAIREQALRFRPKLLICGASAYSRTIDFARFRAIADEVGAYLMADISHIAGLVAAGAHPSPVDHAHFTTTSTYKPGGPRGGLILMGRDFETPFRKAEDRGQKTEDRGQRTEDGSPSSVVRRPSSATPLWERIEKNTFPGFQGTPCLNNIAAKAVFFKEMLSAQYRTWQFGIVENAKVLTEEFVRMGYDVLTGGTDNHMFLANVANLRAGLTGYIVQHCLEDCAIIVNMNRLPYDRHNARITSGMRLGTPIVTRNGMGRPEMQTTARLVDSVLRRVEIQGDRQYCLDPAFQNEVKQQVHEFCTRFPMQ